MKLTPQQLEGFHRECQQKLERGFTVKSGRGVGFTEKKPPGTPVVIYGADWCEPCHAAATYMKMRGIPFVSRDVERDPLALEARNSALRAANLEVMNVLPVIDVRGTVIAGFNPCVVEAAWAN